MTLVLDSDDNIAYSALVIGAPTLAAILISMLHCHILSGYPTGKKASSESISIFRYLLIFSSFSAVIGNIVQVYGIENNSIEFTVSGHTSGRCLNLIQLSHCSIGKINAAYVYSHLSF